ncbi:F-box and leucine-rich repeat protein 2/20 [Dioscorea alata]|uniref:F-box and leucine-rich repeat protein 2/20 n=1 Tax=Dioscorea alata TaxID=55571 RepID=A0ACB7V9Z8_DIOAL|nr:F-box and leucine-rich repeat protein 2/20 [Dioscorea alata]
MDSLLCDELLQEILLRLPQSSSSSISLVSKRWLSLLRSSTSSLAVRLPHPLPPSPILFLSLLLSHFPSLSSLTLLSHPLSDHHLSSHHLLLSISTSPSASHLSSLRLLPRISISPSSLHLPSLSNLTSLHLPSIRPLSFQWLLFFPSLKSLSLIQSTYERPSPSSSSTTTTPPDDSPISPLPLESLSLTGIHSSDHALSWLYRRCSNLRKLLLRTCDSTGDDSSFSYCLPSLLSLDLRTCRTIADRVLLRAADHCLSLTSLTLYDGASHHALHHFLTRRSSHLLSLDLRLPLDLDDAHLLAFPRSLSTLRLQSCCLVSSDALRSLSGSSIQTLALVNCDVVERSPGLLSFLAQTLNQLKTIDLSHNDTLADKELITMLASCKGLTEIKLKGCRSLTDAVVPAIVKASGAQLEFVDVSRCRLISVDAIESLISNARRLKGVCVEANKLSTVAEKLMWQRGIELLVN